MSFISNTLAPQLHVELTDVAATATCGSSLAGLLGVDGADPALSGLSIEIAITSPSPADRVAALRQAWLDRCPVYLSPVRPIDVDVRFTAAAALPDS